MKTFTFFKGITQERFVLETAPPDPIPSMPPAEFYTAVICSRRQTFHDFREILEQNHPTAIFTNGNINYFQMDTRRFFCIRRMDDLYGSNWTDFVTLSDAHLIMDHELLVSYLEGRTVFESNLFT